MNIQQNITSVNSNFLNFKYLLGNVSITPIPKSGINPNIMKLVQNNPHLTIKSMGKKETPQSTSIDSTPPTTPTDHDRTYKCAHCNRSFTNKSQLYFHKKNQCGGSKYPCPFCKKRFGTESAYSSHIFYVHPEWSCTGLLVLLFYVRVIFLDFRERMVYVIFFIHSFLFHFSIFFIAINFRTKDSRWIRSILRVCMYYI